MPDSVEYCVPQTLLRIYQSHLRSKLPIQTTGSFTMGSLLRENFSALDIADSEREYAFVFTQPATAAIALIRDHSAQLTAQRYGETGGLPVSFDAALRDCYEDALSFRMRRKNHWNIKYPGIEMMGDVPMHQADALFALVPMVYCLRNTDGFLSFIEKFPDEKALKYLRAKNSPNNSPIGSIELLATHGVAPLRAVDTKKRMSSRQIHDALELLVPWGCSYTPRTDGGQ